jgi:hypothetical protein
MNTMKRWSLGVAAAALLAVTGSGARADDQKVYPGGMCLPRSQTQSLTRLSWLTYNPTSTAQAGWICPLIRDWKSNNIDAGWVRYIDQDPTAGAGHEVSCALTLVSPGGAVFTITRNSSGSNPSVRTMSFPFVDTSAFGDDGSYLFDCDVPAQTSVGRSGIVAYSVTES